MNPPMAGWAESSWTSISTSSSPASGSWGTGPRFRPCTSTSASVIPMCAGWPPCTTPGTVGAASGVRMNGLPSATRDWLTGPGLTRLWEGVRKRLESNGVQAAGSLRLTAMNAQERNALSLLLGKPLTGAAVTIRLDVLDARLRASAAGLGLRQTLEELGPPLTDRRAARADVAARREQVWSSRFVTGRLATRRPGMAPTVVRPAAPCRCSERSDARNGDLDAPAGGPSPHRSPRARRT